MKRLRFCITRLGNASREITSIKRLTSANDVFTETCPHVISETLFNKTTRCLVGKKLPPDRPTDRPNVSLVLLTLLEKTSWIFPDVGYSRIFSLDIPARDPVFGIMPANTALRNIPLMPEGMFDPFSLSPTLRRVYTRQLLSFEPRNDVGRADH